VVWKYVCPVVLNGPLKQGDAIPDDPARAGEKMNAVFRVYRYPVNYAAFTGKDMKPGDFVEKYTTTSVEEEHSQIPESFRLYPIAPNPFNPRTSIRYELSHSRSVTIGIYSITGQQIRILVDGIIPAGLHRIDWNADDDSGGMVSAGVYLCRLQSGGKAETRKMVLLR
jgi:hypothetical protein